MIFLYCQSLLPNEVIIREASFNSRWVYKQRPTDKHCEDGKTLELTALNGMFSSILPPGLKEPHGRDSRWRLEKEQIEDTSRTRLSTTTE